MSHFYYSKDTRRATRSRIEALAAPEPFYLYFDDDKFCALDWTRGPTESLAELYRQRAQSIRDSYERVILCYSGGIDSTNMLEAFVYNDIRVDDVLTVGALSQDGVEGSDENHNGDLYHNVFPTLGQMDLRGARVRVEDYTKMFDDPGQFRSVQRYGAEWVRDMGSCYSPHLLFWRDLRRIVGGDERTAVVLAVDKPAVYWDWECQRPYTEFSDVNLVTYCQDDENFDRVNFYWDADHPQVLLKQLRVVTEFLVNHVAPLGAPALRTFHDNQTQVVERLIYSVRHPLAHRSTKSKSAILSPRDSYMTRKKGTDIHSLYVEGIRSLRRMLPGVSRKTSMISRRYYLT